MGLAFRSGDRGRPGHAAARVPQVRVDRRHPAVGRAFDFLASFQTDAGDYRGIYGRQYTPNYSAAITELLITAGHNRPKNRHSDYWVGLAVCRMLKAAGTALLDTQA